MYIACNEIGDEGEKYLRDVLQYNIVNLFIYIFIKIKINIVLIYVDSWKIDYSSHRIQISDQGVAYLMNGFKHNRINK